MIKSTGFIYCLCAVKLKRNHILLFLSLAFASPVFSQQDTLKVMSYNVLNYGNYCQGSPSQMHVYLRKIIAETEPDLLGLVKMQSIKRNATDNYGISPQGFGDSILQCALNPSHPGKYKYCPFTNTAAASTMDLLFYNGTKLGYLKTITLCTLISDFNLYKLYYKDPALALHPDTTFLYVLLNHTKSGTSSSQRDSQDSICLNYIRSSFRHLPNLVDMGDFNLHNTQEPGYQYMVQPADTNFRFFDTPFYPDQLLSYPIDWDTNPSLCPPYLTTSTRLSVSLPNNCGTGGGGKDWFDHIVLSPWIVYGQNYIHYLKGSYHTIGNDGHRTSISITDSSVVKNKSAPDSVIEALYQFSNKYPVMLSLVLSSNVTGQSLPDPDIIAGIQPPGDYRKISVLNPVKDRLCIRDLQRVMQGDITITWFDSMGRELDSQTIANEGEETCIASHHEPGIYFIRVNQKIKNFFFHIIQI